MSHMIDLHVHTTASDGTFSPREIVRHAFEQGVKAIAITDHDTIDGVEEALAAGQEFGVEVIPGVEIGVDYPGEMHILGYYLDHHNKKLGENLRVLLQYRDMRNPKIVEKLNELGLHITMDEVRKASGGEVVGRPHIANVLVDKGYVKDNHEAFEKYLAVGKPAYVPKDRLTPENGIELIAAAGGIPVLAHPKYLEIKEGKSLKELIEELMKYGLKGIEAYYTTYTQAESALYLGLAHDFGLIPTGGSDFHGSNKSEILLGRGEGNLSVPYQVLENLKKHKK